jgi:DNA-binding transcriptional regulator YiaG
MSKLQCPACGSDKLQILTEQKSYQLTLGNEFNYLEKIYQCETCGEAGDFDNKNESTFEIAEREALKAHVPYLIEELSKEKISMAQFERAFELPQRTLTRWKTGDFSATAVALLRTIKTYPFIVRVAENRFDQGYAQKALCMEAINLFGSFVNHMEGSGHVEFGSEADGVTIKANAHFPTVRAGTRPVLIAGSGAGD